MIECEHCKKSFVSKSVLTKHQTTAKFCLNIQSVKNTNTIIIKIIRCDHCQKEFGQSSDLVKHHKTCKYKIIHDIKTEKDIEFQNRERDLMQQIQTLELSYMQQLKDKDNTLQNKEIEIVKLQSEIQSLNNRIDKFVIKGIEKSTTTTIINNYENLSMFNFTPEQVREIVYNKYLEVHFNDGKIGFAEFLYKNFAVDRDGNPMYTCSDTARNKFAFRDMNNKIQFDLDANLLIDLVLPDTISKSRMICDEKRERLNDLNSKEFHNANMIIHKAFREIENIRENPSKVRRRLSSKTMNAHKKPLNRKTVSIEDFPTELQRLLSLSEDDWNNQRFDPTWDYDSMRCDIQQMINEQNDPELNEYNYDVYLYEFNPNRLLCL